MRRILSATKCNWFLRPVHRSPPKKSEITTRKSMKSKHEPDTYQSADCPLCSCSWLATPTKSHPFGRWRCYPRSASTSCSPVSCSLSDCCTFEVWQFYRGFRKLVGTKARSSPSWPSFRNLWIEASVINSYGASLGDLLVPTGIFVIAGYGYSNMLLMTRSQVISWARVTVFYLQ